MPSKNVKNQVKENLLQVECNPITLNFKSVLKKKFIDNPTSIEVDGVTYDMPEVIEQEVTIERLKGFQHSDEFKAVHDDSFYEVEDLTVTSRSEEPVKATMNALTNNLFNWLLTNAPKLYQDDFERSADMPIKDRNYAEICGKAQFKADSVHKAYVSRNMTKSVKDTLKTIKTVNQMRVEADLVDAPIQHLLENIMSVTGVTIQMVSSYEEQKKLERANKKQLLLAGIK